MQHNQLGWHPCKAYSNVVNEIDPVLTLSYLNLLSVILQVYNGVDLLAGHCPNKPTLFATQRLSLIFTSKELEENTINPKEKSGKGALDPDRIKLIFGEIYFTSLHYIELLS